MWRKGNSFTINSFWTKFDVWTVNACALTYVCDCMCVRECVCMFCVLFYVWFFIYLFCSSFLVRLAFFHSLSCSLILFQSPRSVFHEYFTLSILWLCFYVCPCMRFTVRVWMVPSVQKPVPMASHNTSVWLQLIKAYRKPIGFQYSSCNRTTCFFSSYEFGTIGALISNTNRYVVKHNDFVRVSPSSRLCIVHESQALI